MAVQTDGSRFGASARETLKRGVSTFGVFGRAVRDKAQDLAVPVASTFADLRDLSRRLRLYDVLTFGPLLRFRSFPSALVRNTVTRIWFRRQPS